MCASSHTPTFPPCPQCVCAAGYTWDAPSGTCIAESCLAAIGGCTDCDAAGKCIACKSTDHFAGSVSADGLSVRRQGQGGQPEAGLEGRAALHQRVGWAMHAAWGAAALMP